MKTLTSRDTAIQEGDTLIVDAPGMDSDPFDERVPGRQPQPAWGEQGI